MTAAGHHYNGIHHRLKTREVQIGDLLLGNFHPIRVQTMTTTDTMDTEATVAQTISCIRAGAELVRITAPSKREAENLLNIKNKIRESGYTTPLVADIHFTPNAAEIAARIVEKVRINPGNYVDKKKFEFIEYTDADYREEVDRIRDRFVPLVRICKQYGTAMRIGTNHGSLSDRIMSRYGDTPVGMVESAMEFLRIARDENYHNIVLSMKSSNPLVMVHAYRLLVHTMTNEFGECYPLHLGVTEAGDGEDGRIKSAIGIGTLLEDGIGDTIRVSLTEDPEFEIPVCLDLVKRYNRQKLSPMLPNGIESVHNPFEYKRRSTHVVQSVGDSHVPVVVADFRNQEMISPKDFAAIGFDYDQALDKWNISDGAADFIYTGHKVPAFPIPGALKLLCDYPVWLRENNHKIYPLIKISELAQDGKISDSLNCVEVNVDQPEGVFDVINDKPSLILCLESFESRPMLPLRNFVLELMRRDIRCPVLLRVSSVNETVDEQLIRFATDCGGPLLDGMGDGIWLRNDTSVNYTPRISGRTYLEVKNNHQFLNNTAFSILQATRTRISKTEYISCPSCGRTLFDLQETTAKIRAVTNHLKGVKIAIMGCIVNGPGEMADADFGYVGSGPGKVTLYKGKDVIKRSVNSEVAVNELINLLKEYDAWVEPQEKVIS